MYVVCSQKEDMPSGVVVRPLLATSTCRIIRKAHVHVTNKTKTKVELKMSLAHIQIRTRTHCSYN